MLSVADTDAALDRARDRGATVQREPYEGHGARAATIIDPFGHRWMLSGPVLGRLALRDSCQFRCAQRSRNDTNRYRTSAIGAPAAILARAFITLPGIPPPTTPTTAPSRS